MTGPRAIALPSAAPLSEQEIAKRLHAQGQLRHVAASLDMGNDLRDKTLQCGIGLYKLPAPLTATTDADDTFCDMPEIPWISFESPDTAKYRFPGPFGMACEYLALSLVERHSIVICPDMALSCAVGFNYRPYKDAQARGAALCRDLGFRLTISRLDDTYGGAQLNERAKDIAEEVKRGGLYDELRMVSFRLVSLPPPTSEEGADMAPDAAAVPGFRTITIRDDAVNPPGAVQAAQLNNDDDDGNEEEVDDYGDAVKRPVRADDPSIVTQGMDPYVPPEMERDENLDYVYDTALELTIKWLLVRGVHPSAIISASSSVMATATVLLHGMTDQEIAALRVLCLVAIARRAILSRSGPYQTYMARRCNAVSGMAMNRGHRRSPLLTSFVSAYAAASLSRAMEMGAGLVSSMFAEISVGRGRDRPGMLIYDHGAELLQYSGMTQFYLIVTEIVRGHSWILQTPSLATEVETLCRATSTLAMHSATSLVPYIKLLSLPGHRDVQPRAFPTLASIALKLASQRSSRWAGYRQPDDPNVNQHALNVILSQLPDHIAAPQALTMKPLVTFGKSADADDDKDNE